MTPTRIVPISGSLQVGVDFPNRKVAVQLDRSRERFDLSLEQARAFAQTILDKADLLEQGE